MLKVMVKYLAVRQQQEMVWSSKSNQYNYAVRIFYICFVIFVPFEWDLHMGITARCNLSHLSDIADMKMVIDTKMNTATEVFCYLFTTGGTDQQSSTGISCLDALITQHAQSLRAQRLCTGLLLAYYGYEPIYSEECNETLADGYFENMWLLYTSMVFLANIV